MVIRKSQIVLAAAALLVLRSAALAEESSVVAALTQTPGAWTVQFNLSGLSAYVTLMSSNPSIFPLPASQIGVISATTFGFDVVPGAVTAPTLIQVTANFYGTTATASVILQPQQ
jgi:hypothetical protein